MKLSPLDIYNHEFKKSAFGYNTAEVEEFLDDVGVAYEKLLKEINSLKDENSRIKQQLENYEKIDQKLQNTLETIQHTVQEEKKQARSQANLIIKDAKRKAEKIKEEARSSVDKEYKKLDEVKEEKKLFEIRFRTLLESHLEMLEDQKEQDNNVVVDQYEEDIAVSSDE